MKKNLFIFMTILISGLSFNYQSFAENEPEGNVCDNEYVLCTSAPCIPDPSNPDTKAICACEVNKGLNYGYSDCEARTPNTGVNDVRKALSTYSFAQALGKAVLACPKGKPWTDCLDQPCIVDPKNPIKAICACKIVRDQAFVTYGGRCNTLTCDTGYWSGATVDSFLFASKEFAKKMGLDEMPAMQCPGQKAKP